MSDAFPITIRMNRKQLEDLSLSECGSYEDIEAAERRGETELYDRKLSTHAYMVAQRFRSKLEIRNAEEAEDMYFAVCSGTFQIDNYSAAERIANILRPHARRDTKALWPKPRGI